MQKFALFCSARSSLVPCSFSASPANREALARRQSAPFSYPQVGATRTAPPGGWRIQHMRALVGTGRRRFGAAVGALLSWKLLAVDGLEVFPSAATLEQGTSVVIYSRHFGIWSFDFCQVLYVLKDEPQGAAHGLCVWNAAGPGRARRRSFHPGVTRSERSSLA